MGGIYTAEMGQPPMEEDSGILNLPRSQRGAMPKAPKKESRPRPDPRDANIYTAEKGQPPMEEDSGILNKPKKAKKYARGGSVGSASKRADGIAQRGKTKGKML